MSTDNHDKDIGKTDKSIETPLIKPVKVGVLSNLRSSFFAGIVVIAPIGITVALIYWFVTGPMERLDRFVKNILPAGDSNVETITRAIPGFGVLVAIIAIVLLGAFAKNFLGRALIKIGEDLLDSMPIVRTLYRFFKNVFETALQQSERSFKEVVLVEYPRHGIWAIAFVISETKGEVRHALQNGDDPMISLFVPTVPNPTSGFLLFSARSALKTLSMSVEDAAKLVFSMGLVAPEFSTPEQAIQKLEAVAEAARRDKKARLPIFGGRSE